MGASKKDVQEAMTDALAGQPKHVSYPDYKTSEDFTLWLAGFYARIRLAHGYKLEEDDKVKKEVLRSISGKLSVGSALDAYERLSADERKDYSKLVTALTNEFVDPHEKRKFNENMVFNRRKKGQKLKEFMQDVKKDMKRYSSLPAKITVVEGTAQAPTTRVIDNPEYERQGVRRFRAGMRDQDGKKDDDLRRHLKYHLVDDDELTWKTALKISSRWELADSGPESSSSESDDGDSDDEVKAVEVKKSEGKKKGKKSKGKGKCADGVISTLADQVQINQMKIKTIETAQERLQTSVSSLKTSQDATNCSLQEISAKLDVSIAQGANRGTQPQQQYRYQTPQQQQPQRFQQPQQNALSRQQTFSQAQQRGRGGFRPRPANYTWHGRMQQPRQGNYGYNRGTPTSFPQTNAKPTTAASTQPKSTNATAALEDKECPAETLVGAEGEEEETVTVSMAEFLWMSTKAGVEIPDEDLILAVEDLNFQ